MLYDYPEYYEVAFSFRDIPREAVFIQACIDRYSDISVTNIFEVGCGFAPHAEVLQNLGYQYIGLDINLNMLDYAKYKWRHLNPQPKFIEADMVNFKYFQKVDFAFVMLGSLYLNSMEEITSHFDSMSRLLNKGSLYFLDWCIQFSDPMEYKNNNDFSIEKDGITIESRFNIRLLNPTHQMYEEIWTVNVNDNGRHRTFNMIERNKAILPQEFLKFIDSRKDFKFVGWWKDWDFNKPIDNQAEIIRPVALIKKIQ